MINQNIPGPSIPVLGPDGRISQVWFQFFISLFNRTGGSQGNDLDAILTALGDLQITSSGGTATDSTLAARLAELETQINRGEGSDDLRARVSNLEVQADAGQVTTAAAAEIKGYSKVTIAGVARTIPYY